MQCILIAKGKSFTVTVKGIHLLACKAENFDDGNDSGSEQDAPTLPALKTRLINAMEEASFDTKELLKITTSSKLL